MVAKRGKNDRGNDSCESSINTVPINSFWELMKYWCRPMYFLKYNDRNTSVFLIKRKVLFDIELTESILNQTGLSKENVYEKDYDVNYSILLTDNEIALQAFQIDFNELTTHFYPLTFEGWEKCVTEIDELIFDFCQKHYWIEVDSEIVCKKRHEY